MARFQDIPKFIPGGSYTVDVPLSHLSQWLDSQAEGGELNIDPDFQRGHVWTDAQRSRYVEFLLRGGQSQLTLYWNHPSYTGSHSRHCNLADELVLVDGKQRLTASLKFMADEIPVFGHFLHEFDDPIDRRAGLGLTGARLRMNVNNLQTMAEVLQWYLDLNDGGVVHTEAEIRYVRLLLKKEMEASGTPDPDKPNV